MPFSFITKKSKKCVQTFRLFSSSATNDNSPPLSLSSSFKLELNRGIRYLKEDDVEFLEKVIKDLDSYLSTRQSIKSILLFPPLNNWRRFLIHNTVCDSYAAKHALSSLSVGEGAGRRILVCDSSLNKDNSAAVVPKTKPNPRNSICFIAQQDTTPPTYTQRFSNSNPIEKTQTNVVGVQTTSSQISSVPERISPRKVPTKKAVMNIYTPPHMRRENEMVNTKVVGERERGDERRLLTSSENLERRCKTEPQSKVNRARRPDQKVYVPRALRTSLPASNTIHTAITAVNTPLESNRNNAAETIETRLFSNPSEESTTSQSVVIANCSDFTASKVGKLNEAIGNVEIMSKDTDTNSPATVQNAILNTSVDTVENTERNVPVNIVGNTVSDLNENETEPDTSNTQIMVVSQGAEQNDTLKILNEIVEKVDKVNTTVLSKNDDLKISNSMDTCSDEIIDLTLEDSCSEMDRINALTQSLQCNKYIVNTRAIKISSQIEIDVANRINIHEDSQMDIEINGANRINIHTDSQMDVDESNAHDNSSDKVVEPDSEGTNETVDSQLENQFTGTITESTQTSNDSIQVSEDVEGDSSYSETETIVPNTEDNFSKSRTPSKLVTNVSEINEYKEYAVPSKVRLVETISGDKSSQTHDIQLENPAVDIVCIISTNMDCDTSPVQTYDEKLHTHDSCDSGNLSAESKRHSDPEATNLVLCNKDLVESSTKSAQSPISQQVDTKSLTEDSSNVPDSNTNGNSLVNNNTSELSSKVLSISNCESQVLPISKCNNVPSPVQCQTSTPESQVLPISKCNNVPSPVQCQTSTPESQVLPISKCNNVPSPVQCQTSTPSEVSTHVEVPPLSKTADVIPSPSSTGSPTQPKSTSPVNLNPDECDWETLYDDDGECLVPDIMNELMNKMGKVSVQTPSQEYRSYQSAEERTADGENILEIYGFTSSLTNRDLMDVFAAYARTYFHVKWVDDTHALGVFSSPAVADEVLNTNLPNVRTRPLREAIPLSRSKAKALLSTGLPLGPRPKTCLSSARRLVSGALGIRVQVSESKREEERQMLRDAREKKRQEAKLKHDIWEKD